MVITHRIRKPQAPVSETSMGITEYPSPRRLPTIQSIIPQIKYVLHIMRSRRAP